VTDPETLTTYGRLWPIFAGERGEYDLAAYSVFGAETHLIAMGLTANEGYLLSEQVWDNQPPFGQPGFAPGTGTTSATPLAWTHAQFIRLAFDIAAGRLLEQPAVVARRYLSLSFVCQGRTRSPHSLGIKIMNARALLPELSTTVLVNRYRLAR